MTHLLAIDPGSEKSGWVIIDTDDGCKPLGFGKTPNTELLRSAYEIDFDSAAIEMVASYGMPVGAEVFETCVWIGRFCEAIELNGITPRLVTRQPIKLHHCHSPKATDATVRQALVDRFAYGQPNHGKGAKDAPGFFHGFKADVWQAFALAIYAADQLQSLNDEIPF